MSDEAKVKMAARIIPAEEAKELPRWELGNFSRLRSSSSLARPQSQQDQLERARSMMRAQQQREAAEQAEQARLEAARRAAEAAEKEQRAREESARKIQELAFEEGYQKGHEQGLQEARQDLSHLAELARQLSQTQQALEAGLAPRVVDLALLIARQVVARELAQDPALILEVARQAMAQLSGHSSQRVLKLHPQDFALLHQQLGNELGQAGWQLQADPSLTRGGCRIHSTDTEVDATLETRWQRTLATVGSALSWTQAGTATQPDSRAELAPTTPPPVGASSARESTTSVGANPVREPTHHDGQH
ncbi:MAG: FliH/SctL family protein [Pigmentiphaga sp.]